MGLDKVGKGNWNQIAKQFVPSRSSTQVTTDAENFFGRHNKNRAALKRTSFLLMEAMSMSMCHHQLMPMPMSHHHLAMQLQTNLNLMVLPCTISI
ncbi:hypothetical protein RDI58_012941 [Solanum bulbocastanum]|uniref:Uncharacterized protein n=1 Tax=Solanum bulbocastanum TaxID=147425 RepID=A0AAN8TQ00_SOLBU